MNIPNLLTSLRILLVPVIILLILRDRYLAAMWLLLGAGVTDALDGFIARRFNQLTHLGAILDPLADKTLVVATFLVLAGTRLVPWWLAAAVVLRDLVILCGAAAWYRRAGCLEIDPSWLSKANTFFQISLLYLVIGTHAGIAAIGPWLPILFSITFSTTVFSGLHYVVIWGRRAQRL